jgi:hypothetical protein
MKRKRHSSEEIIRKLREADKLAAAGETPGQICQKLEISEATLGRWKQQFRGMGEDEIKRMRSLEEENRRLRKAVSDLTIDKQILKEIAEGKF